MARSRRDFLSRTALGVLAVAARSATAGEPAATPEAGPAPLAPASPPAFGTAAATGPLVDAGTFSEAQKLVQVELTAGEKAQAASNWRLSMAALHERRSGPRKVALEPSVVPATVWNPAQPALFAHGSSAPREQFLRSPATKAPLPATDDAIAFAPLHQLSRWIESRKLTSERLTKIYLDAPASATIPSSLHHHPHPRSGARRRRSRRYRDRRRQLSRPIAWHPLGRERSARHRGHPHHLGRRAVSRSRARGRRRGGGAAHRARRGAGGQAQPGRAGAQRRLVRRPDHQPVAAWRRARPASARVRARPPRRAWSDSPSAARPAAASSAPRCAAASTACAHLRPRRAHRRHDAVLVARQAGPDGARRGGHAAGAARRSPAPDASDPRACGAAGVRCAEERGRACASAISRHGWTKPPATDVDRAALGSLRALGMKPAEVSLPDWPYDSLELILFAEGGRVLRGVDPERTGSISSRRRSPTPGPTASARRASSPRWTSCRPTGCAARWRGDGAHFWRGRSAAGPFTARRDAHHHQLHRPPSLTLRAGFVEISRGAQRLGARIRRSPSRPLPSAACRMG